MSWMFHLYVIFAILEWLTLNCLQTRTLMGSKNVFCKITANVFPSWYSINTHLNAPGQQTAKTCTFIEVLTFVMII